METFPNEYERLRTAGKLLGFIGGFLIAALIMMGIFGTSYGKALAATVLAWVLSEE